MYFHTLAGWREKSKDEPRNRRIHSGIGSARDCKSRGIPYDKPPVNTCHLGIFGGADRTDTQKLSDRIELENIESNMLDAVGDAKSNLMQTIGDTESKLLKL